MIKRKTLALFLPVLAACSFALDAHAATISLLPEARLFGVGKEFIVDVVIDTEEAFINAGQATIQFPVGILELMSADKSGSAFGFWPDEPKISNEDGTLMFTGGASKGISGGALHVLKLKFRAKGTGLAELTLRDAVVAASDGKGTNVLSSLKGTTITIGTAAAPALPDTGDSPSPTKAPDAPKPIAEEPTKVVRTPKPAQKLPQKPELRVPLYLDETRWYSYPGEMAVFWNVPEDVIEVSAVLDGSPNTKPVKAERELFTGKKFGLLGEGVWYLHVRFRNNVGWGETAHYKISIDTTPPLPFEVDMNAFVSDDPSPEIRYEAHDVLSGISHALIFVDDKELLRSTTTATTLPPQAPGKHALLVRIFDFAGNSVEDSPEFEILPLPTPSIEFVTRSISQSDLVFVSGRSIPNAFIDARVLNASGQEVFMGTVPSDGDGNWKIAIDTSLPTGRYAVSVTARDERGATSYPANEEVFKVRPKTILSFGFVDLGWFEIFMMVMLLIVAGTSLIAWRYVSRKNTREAYGIIVGRDIEKMGTLLSGYVKELEDAERLQDPSRSAKVALLIERMGETIAKMKKYLGEEVSKLK